MKNLGYLVLETGECYQGVAQISSAPVAGEVVFNTSHSGYEEIATDPSYYSQIVVMTTPMQGNYGINRNEWEHDRLWLSGFVCLEIQNSEKDASWMRTLREFKVGLLSQVDTRSVTLRIRSGGTPWGALVAAQSSAEAKSLALEQIEKAKNKDQDWCFAVSTPQSYSLPGHMPNGPRVAVIDYGCKKNILRNLQSRSTEVRVFNSRTSAKEVLAFSPALVVLSNGPGDPEKVVSAREVVRELLGQVPLFGICMGHQILSLALGAQTYKLPFGHRGGNHPVQDRLLNKTYMTSQNHGYAVRHSTLPAEVELTHTNLYDGTLEGFYLKSKKVWSVQFHPESAPGPHEAVRLFDFVFEGISK